MNLRAAVRASRVPAVLLMAVLAGVSYPYTFAVHFPPEKAVAWKGLGVGLLAVWAAMNAKERDGWLLAATLALWAAADVVLELSFVGGAALFAAGHAVALTLFWWNRVFTGRAPVIRAGALLALAVLVGVVVGRLASPLSWQAGAYALLLFVMAAIAHRSRFRAAGWGALLFVTSDWLLLLRQGSPDPPEWIAYPIWLLYFTGVLLIALSIRAALDRDRALV